MSELPRKKAFRTAAKSETAKIAEAPAAPALMSSYWLLCVPKFNLHRSACCPLGQGDADVLLLEEISDSAETCARLGRR
jgi:hypothetical protein